MMSNTFMVTDNIADNKERRRDKKRKYQRKEQRRREKDARPRQTRYGLKGPSRFHRIFSGHVSAVVRNLVRACPQNGAVSPEGAE
jgi:hypothetical protein